MNFCKDGYPLFKIVSKDGSKKDKIMYMSGNPSNPKYMHDYTCTLEEELVVMPNSETERECIAAFARSGAGKSYQLKKYIEQWLKQKKNKGKNVVIFSSLPCDKTMDSLGDKIKRIKLDISFCNKPVSLTWLEGSCVVFDDTDVISNIHIRRKVNSIKNACLQIGRHHNITTLVTSHNFCNVENKITLNESVKFYIYPKVGFNRGLVYLLENYRGLTPKQIKKLKKLDSRWVCIDTNKYSTIICNNKAYMLNVVDEDEEDRF